MVSEDEKITEGEKSDESSKPATPKKSKKVTAVKAKKKQANNHPAYLDMVKAAIGSLKENKGSSRAAILKYVLQHYKFADPPAQINSRIRLALKRGVQNGVLKQSNGVGASGSFRLSVTKETTKVVKKITEKATKPKKKSKAEVVKRVSKEGAKKPKKVKKAAMKSPKKSPRRSEGAKTAAKTKKVVKSTKPTKKVGKKSVA